MQTEKILMELNISLFFIKFDELLEKFKETWEKVSNIIKTGLSSESVYNEKGVKIKRKSYDGKININFHKDKVPKEACQWII